MLPSHVSSLGLGRFALKARESGAWLPDVAREAAARLFLLRSGHQ